jgi:hypothetical protein
VSRDCGRVTEEFGAARGNLTLTAGVGRKGRRAPVLGPRVSELYAHRWGCVGGVPAAGEHLSPRRAEWTFPRNHLPFPRDETNYL